jgi:hypothetical protein
MSDRECVVATCVCGGWVVMAVLGGNERSDRDTWREVGKLARLGFRIRTPVSVAECRAMPSCDHNGDCTTDPEKARVKQEQLALTTEAE